MVKYRGGQIIDSGGEMEAWLEKIQFLSDAMESTSQPFCAGDRDGSILIFNEAFCRLTGYTREELYDINWATDLTVPETLENELKALKVLDQTHQPQRYENSYRRKDGTVVPVELLVDLASDSKGRTLFYYAFVTDITKRKQADKALRLAKFTINNSSDELLWIEPNGHIFDVNKAASAALEYTPEELRHMYVWEIDPNYTREVWPSHWRELKKRRVLNFESTQRAKSGRTFPTEVTVNYIEFEGAEYNCGVVRDITERKRADEALRESEAGLAKAQRIAHLGSYTLDTRLDRARCSDEFYRILGIAPLDFFSLPSFLNYVYAEDRDTLEREYRRSIDQGRSYNGEFRIVRPDGEVRTIRGDGEPVLDESGCTVEMFGIIQDITERKLAEESLIESEEKFRVLAETAPVGIMLFREDKYIYTNRYMQNILGYSEDELLALNFWDVIHPDFRELVRVRGRERLQGLSVPTRYELMVMSSWLQLRAERRAGETTRGR